MFSRISKSIPQLISPIALLEISKEIIAIVLMGRLGDIVASEPIIEWVRSHYPKRKIAYILPPPLVDILIAHPSVDYIVPLSDSAIAASYTRKFPDNIKSLFLTIENGEWKGLGNSLLPRSRKVRHENYYFWNGLLGCFSRMVGLPELTEQPRFYLSDQTETPFKIENEYIVFHACSQDSTRDWSKEKWKKLAEYFFKQGKFVVEIGFSSVLHLNHPFYYDASGLDIQQTAKIINESCFFFGVDSGPAHIANALGIDGICILGDLDRETIYSRYVPYTGKYSEGHIIRAKHGRIADDVTFEDVIKFYQKKDTLLAKITETAKMKYIQNIYNPIMRTSTSRALAKINRVFHRHRSNSKGITQKMNEPCRAPFVFAEIFPNGDVFPCCPIFIKRKPIGNIFTNNFSDIWNSEIAKNFRIEFLNCDYSRCNLDMCGKHDYLENIVIENDAPRKLRKLMPSPYRVKFSHDGSCNICCTTCRDHIVHDIDVEKLNARIEKYYLPVLKGVKKVCFAGNGDPFGSRHYMTLMPIIARTYPNILFDLHTNGLACNEENCRQAGILERMDTVQITVNAASEEIYKKIMRGSNWEEVNKNLRWLSSRKKKKKLRSLILLMVVESENFREMPGLVELAHEINADKVFFWEYRARQSELPSLSERLAEYDITDYQHRDHLEFINVCRNPILRDKIVYAYPTIKRFFPRVIHDWNRSLQDF